MQVWLNGMGGVGTWGWKGLFRLSLHIVTFLTFNLLFYLMMFFIVSLRCNHLKVAFCVVTQGHHLREPPLKSTRTPRLGLGRPLLVPDL